MPASQALRIVASRPDPAIVTLPWSLPLEQWTEHVVPLPRGLSRHIVRIVRLGERTYAVKETVEPIDVSRFELVERLRRDFRLRVPSFGHAGDGNIHVNFMVDPGDSDEVARARAAAAAEWARC